MEEDRCSEQEVLEAIYGDDLEVLNSGQEYCLKLAQGKALLRLSLPKGYPSDAPVPYFENGSEALPASLDARSFCQALLSTWLPGQVCVYEWAQKAEEALQQAFEADPTNCITDPVLAEHKAGECVLPVSADMSQALGSSLAAAGFASFGPGIFSHGSSGVTVEVSSESASICVDGIDSEDLEDFAQLQLQSIDSFGAALLRWVTAQRSQEPGFDEEEEAGSEPGVSFLPSPEDLHVKTDRDLHIYTWGKALRKAPPPDSQFNFNAGVLNGRGGGADLRTMNGLSEEVQRNVASCGLFPRWLRW